MHRIKNTLIVAAACIAIATCSLQAKTKAPPGPQQKIVKASNDFAVRIYRQLAGEKGNLFFSPSSIHTAMSMTLTGAKGRTEQQMQKVLGFSDAAPHKGYAQLLKTLAPGKDAGYELRVANALWGQRGYPWLKDFLVATKDNYGAGLRKVDYAASEAARKTINDWVEDQTNKKIKDLIPAGVLDSLTRLVLTNAIYFKGVWTTQFDKKATRSADFTTLGGKKIKVPLMHCKGRYGYLADRKTGLQIASIPYKGDELSMVVLLPKSPEDLGALTATLRADRLAGWIAAMRKQEIDLYLPRFKMTSSFRLKDALVKMGMADAFSRRAADFSGMNGKKDLRISAVIHKAFVDVNEEGTEAAAATAVVMKIESAHITPVFRADRPFLLLIRHNPTGTILFMGRVTEPTGDRPGGMQDAGAAARKFWQAVASADAAGMKKLYAPQITVKKGSEFLKAKYALGADRGSDAVVTSDKLVAAYRTIFDDNPNVKAKWISIFKKFTGDKITIAPAGKDNSPFADVKRGDTIMTVNTGDDDNALIFVLRNVGGKGWLVVAERTDY